MTPKSKELIIGIGGVTVIIVLTSIGFYLLFKNFKAPKKSDDSNSQTGKTGGTSGSGTSGTGTNTTGTGTNTTGGSGGGAADIAGTGGLGNNPGGSSVPKNRLTLEEALNILALPSILVGETRDKEKLRKDYPHDFLILWAEAIIDKKETFEYYGRKFITKTGELLVITKGNIKL
jgi:hypothetical protein